MKSRHLVAMLALAASRPAAAESHKLLVLQSEGRTDAATRAKIDAAIVKLATAAEPQTSAGELNFSDAATAVGCKPEAATCKDEVLGMLAVDEIVITTVTPKPGGTEIAVRRVTKGGASRALTMLLASGTPPDKLDGIAPLFGVKPAAHPGPATPAGPAPSPASPAPAIMTTGHPAGEPLVPAPTAVGHVPPQPPVATRVASEPMSPPPADRSNTRRHNLEIAGMAGGGGMVVIGLLLWGAASSVQGDIDKAPTTTQQDLTNLRNLESKGDGYAGLGNLFTVGGLVLGGIGTYFYIKDRRTASTTSARLMPTVFDHGAGVVLTFGGTP